MGDGMKADNSRQETQQELSERALRIPGVAEAVEVYEAVEDRKVEVTATTGRTGYATGANA